MRIRKSRLNCTDDAVIKEYMGGKSLSEITKVLPISITGAWKVLKMYGVKLRTYQSPSREKHWNWKGDKAGYGAIHGFINRAKGKPNKCDNPNCEGKSKVFEWANINGHKYTRNIEDYIRLCRSCHRRMDYGIIKLKP